MARVVVLGISGVDFVTRNLQQIPKEGMMTETDFTIRYGSRGLFQAMGCKNLGEFPILITSLGVDPFGQSVKTFLQDNLITGRDIWGNPAITGILHDSMMPMQYGPNTRLPTTVVVVLTVLGKPTCYVADVRYDPKLPTLIQSPEVVADIHSSDVILTSFDTDLPALQALQGVAGHAPNPIPFILHAYPVKDCSLSVIQGSTYLVISLADALEWLKLFHKEKGDRLAKVNRIAREYQDAKETANIDQALHLAAFPTQSILDLAGEFQAFDPQSKIILNMGDFETAVVDGQQVRRYSSYRVQNPTGFSGVRAEFCAALATKLAQNRNVPEHDLISFASAASARVRIAGSDPAKLPDDNDVTAHIRQYGRVEVLPL